MLGLKTISYFFLFHFRMATEAKRPKLAVEELSDLKDFHIKRILNEFSDTKKIFLEGRMLGDEESIAILILEKMPFNSLKVKDLLANSTLKLQFKNDIYGQFECQTDPSLNVLKTNLIYPATEKHIQKYISSKTYIIEETPSFYETITLPFIKGETFSLEWVYNILEHKKESERIVYEDPDANTGFVLLPDFKWNGKQVEDLYLLAIVHQRDIKSIRDLNHRHLPLLKKMMIDGTKSIQGM